MTSVVASSNGSRITDRFGGDVVRAGVPLAANQVNYSLLRRAAETNGVLEACRELDLALVAYFPLASDGQAARRISVQGPGRLSGSSHLPRCARISRSFRPLLD